MNEDILNSLSKSIIECCERFSSWEGAVSKLGNISPAQMRTIGVIGRNRNLRMKDIAEKLELTTGTVTVMVDRLQDMGLVERSKNEGDRRSYRIILSPRGEIYFQEHRKKQKDMVQRLVSRLSVKEIESFSLILDKISSSFS